MKKILFSFIALFLLAGCGDLTSKPSVPDYPGVDLDGGDCNIALENVTLDYTIQTPQTKRFTFNCGGSISWVGIYFENDTDDLFLVNGEQRWERNLIYNTYNIDFSLNQSVDYSLVSNKTAKLILKYYNKNWDMIIKEYTITAIP